MRHILGFSVVCFWVDYSHSRAFTRDDTRFFKDGPKYFTTSVIIRGITKWLLEAGVHWLDEFFLWVQQIDQLVGVDSLGRGEEYDLKTFADSLQKLPEVRACPHIHLEQRQHNGTDKTKQVLCISTVVDRKKTLFQKHAKVLKWPRNLSFLTN